VTVAVVRVQGLATVQDLGVHGFMHEALPPGGALVPELLVAANRTVRNPDDAIGIEVQGRLVVRAMGVVVVAIDGEAARELAPATELEVVSGTRRCAYLAVRGGFLGAVSRDRQRGAVISAGIGGGLVAGATLDVGAAPATSATTGPVGSAVGHFIDGAVITVLAGPDLDAFGDDALAILASAPYRVLPASNRVGTRLAGQALPRRAEVRERSRPMVCGALEVPRDGQPIVLGPEHPTTGGYPVIGVIASAELGRFHAIRLGGSVQFVVSRVPSSPISSR
jgi:allophanate hydrolase subunit 2